MYEAQLGPAGRRSFQLFCGLFLGSHAVVPYLLTGTSVFENPALRAFVLTAFTKVAVFRDVLSQFIVIALIHVLFLWIVLILARPRKPPTRWWQHPALVVWITGLAAWWLVVDWNNRLFVHSLWR
ncbi:MAG TPA: hypothetical protein VJM11_09575, partial [Nevskiaceae bacterium]|nr:hypothetical protein [Nevskiaceae bacterium]